MRYLILSDIHSNYQAFSRILEEEEYDAVLFLGDIVGYAGDPYLCYKTFLECGGRGVLGNHEFGAIKPHTLLHFSENARLGMQNTLRSIPAEYVTHMATLPDVLEVEDFLLCHTMLGKPMDFPYVFPEDKDSPYLRESFQLMRSQNKRILFTGHTHRPCIFKESLTGQIETYKAHDGVVYLDEQPYVINVGSVGQPRNGNPKAQYVVYDALERRVTFKSQKYDISGAEARIREAGLPDFLWQRLYQGI